MNPDEPLVLTDRTAHAGIICLNRPRALNALTLPMVRLMRRGLESFLADPAVSLIILEAVEGRAFCAGGDIRACAESGRAGDGVAEAFWREEYELIARLAASPKPVVALMNGIVMGGGAGLAMHLRHRVVSETARFAMPEVGIGFLPDVGASYLLPRLPNAAGLYLAVTGQAIGPGDMLTAGLADHLVPAADMPDLRQALTALSGTVSHDRVAAVIAGRAGSAAPDVFTRHGGLISRAFATPDIAAILRSLAAVTPDDPDASFAAATTAIIAGASPFSLDLTAELMRRGAAAPSLEDCLVREYRAASFCLSVPDFHEGVRAALIDKDRRPEWPSKAPGTVHPAIETVLTARPGQPDPVFVGR